MIKKEEKRIVGNYIFSMRNSKYLYKIICSLNLYLFFINTFLYKIICSLQHCTYSFIIFHRENQSPETKRTKRAAATAGENERRDKMSPKSKIIMQQKNAITKRHERGTE